jgi:hypothetical protein
LASVEAVVLAVVREGFVGPRLLQDFERLVKPLAAFRIGHAIGGVAARVAAAPGAEDEAPAADHIDRRGLLGQAQRMGQRQDVHRGADLDALGARGDLAGDIHRRAQHRAARLLVNLGEPEHVEAPFVGGFDLLEALREGIGVRLPRHLPVKLMIPAELHGFALFTAPSDA